MAIQLIGGASGALQEVDATFKAARFTDRPPEAINWNSIGTTSGLLTGVAAAGIVYSFRNTGANLFMVRRVAVGFVTTTAFSTAQGLQYQMVKANAFTISDTGGTPFYVAGANKHRNGMTNITSAPDIRMSGAAALTAGTRTLEASPIGLLNGTSNGVGTSMPVQNLFQHDVGDYPLIIAQNEGFEILNGLTMGASGVLSLQILVEYAEVTAF